MESTAWIGWQRIGATAGVAWGLAWTVVSFVSRLFDSSPGPLLFPLLVIILICLAFGVLGVVLGNLASLVTIHLERSEAGTTEVSYRVLGGLLGAAVPLIVLWIALQAEQDDVPWVMAFVALASLGGTLGGWAGDRLRAEVQAVRVLPSDTAGSTEAVTTEARTSGPTELIEVDAPPARREPIDRSPKPMPVRAHARRGEPERIRRADLYAAVDEEAVTGPVDTTRRPVEAGQDVRPVATKVWPKVVLATICAVIGLAVIGYATFMMVLLWAWASL